MLALPKAAQHDVVTRHSAGSECKRFFFVLCLLLPFRSADCVVFSAFRSLTKPLRSQQDQLVGHGSYPASDFITASAYAEHNYKLKHPATTDFGQPSAHAADFGLLQVRGETARPFLALPLPL